MGDIGPEDGRYASLMKRYKETNAMEIWTPIGVYMVVKDVDEVRFRPVSVTMESRYGKGTVAGPR